MVASGQPRSPLFAFLRRRLRNPLSLIAPLHLPPGLLDSPRTTRRAKDYSNPRLFGPLTASLERLRRFAAKPDKKIVDRQAASPSSWKTPCIATRMALEWASI